MKTLIKVLVLVLCTQFSFGQNNERISLHGQVVNDSIKLESGYVVNITAETRSLIKANGLFDILAKPNDVLLFSSMTFQPKKIVLSEKNLQERLFLVKIEAINNELKEVVVSNRMKVKSINANSQGYVDTKFFDDAQSSPKNQVMTRDGAITDGVDFVRIFKEVKKVFNKKTGTKSDVIDDVAFSRYVKGNFDPIFFERELKLKKDEVDLFLMFASDDAESKSYLRPEDKFLLMDFLISKNTEFKRISTFEE